MTRNLIVALGCMLALTLGPSAAEVASKAKANPAQAFMSEAVQGDLAEIQIGHLAQKKGATPAVKQFGEKLVRDHTANLAQAKLAADSLGLSVPSTPNDEQKATYDRLSSLSGPEFDKQFAAHMVKDHKKDIAKFQVEAKQHSPTGNFAKLSLPKLQQHLQIAQSLTRATSGLGQ